MDHHQLQHQVSILDLSWQSFDEIDWTSNQASSRLGPVLPDFLELQALVESLPAACLVHLLDAGFTFSTNAGLAVGHAIWSLDLFPGCPRLTERVLRGYHRAGQSADQVADAHFWQLDPSGQISFGIRVGSRASCCHWIPVAGSATRHTHSRNY